MEIQYRYNEPGLRIDIATEKEGVQIYEHQFDPYNGLFGCNIFDLPEGGFNGTMFRLPLRQAGFPRSEISDGHYDHYRIKLMIDKLKQDADNLLLFLKKLDFSPGVCFR